MRGLNAKGVVLEEKVILILSTWGGGEVERKKKRKKKLNLSAQSLQSLHGRRTIRCVDFDVFSQNLKFVFRHFSPRFSGILAMEK